MRRLRDLGLGQSARPPTSPTSASTRCSTAGRSRPASSPPTARRSTSTARWASSPTSSRPPACEQLPGGAAIGHVRYSTAGASHAQERAADRGRVRGRLDRGRAQRQPGQRRRAARAARGAGLDLPATTDTEVIVHLMARAPAGTPGTSETGSSVRQALRAGARRLLAPLPDRGRADRRARSHGLPPAGARAGSRGATCLASETCAFDLIEAEYVREVEPGEMVIIDERRAAQRAARPDQRRAARRRAASSSTSTSRGPTRSSSAQSVYAVRKRAGPPPGDRAPGRGRRGHPGARLGRARRHRLRRARAASPSTMGLIRSHYVGRTFIEPQQSIRHFGVKLKLNARARRARRQARGGGRRLDRARHDQAQDREDDPRRRRARGAPAHQLAADRLALLLRHRHADAPGADRLQPHGRGDRDATSPPTRSATSRCDGHATRPSGEARASFCDACFSGEYLIQFSRRPTAAPLRVVGG